jgi:7-carboxy-7-deazaguanine synthase
MLRKARQLVPEPVEGRLGMMYRVKEIFYSIQGEGFHSGRAAVFCRFSGCNLWSGREEDREKAPCSFCDTDFTGTNGPGGGIYITARELVTRLRNYWPQTDVTQRDAGNSGRRPFVVCTGGEPLLQLDEKLLDEFHGEGFEVAVETNGSIAVPVGMDWICVSPKAGVPLRQISGNELKLVYPQKGIHPDDYAKLDFEHFFLQPRSGPGEEMAIRTSLDYVLSHPQWRLSLQMHKILGVP